MRWSGTFMLLSAVAVIATAQACKLGLAEGIVVACLSLILIGLAARRPARGGETYEADTRRAFGKATQASNQNSSEDHASTETSTQHALAQASTYATDTHAVSDEQDSAKTQDGARDSRDDTTANESSAIQNTAPTATAPTEATVIATADLPTAPEDEARASFSFDDFRMRVLLAEDPLDVLRSIVHDIRSKEEDASSQPTDVELFLARLLEEADLFSKSHDKDDEMPALRIVWPLHGDAFYVRCPAHDLQYGAYLRMLRIEAALNALRYACGHFEDPASTTQEELFKFWQRMTTSICAQGEPIDNADWSYLAMPWQAPFGPKKQGEWAVRQGMSEAIESAQVPYRLEANFRSNVSAGDVAIEFKATPSRVFPRSSYVPGLGIVPTTSQMRLRAASDYAARMGILLASHAFATSNHIRRVWIAAILETPTKHDCWYSVCFERRAFARLRLSSIPQPLATLRSFGATIRADQEILVPTEQSFYLEDSRFCPRMRHDLWELSERALPASAALSLGANRVSGLFIHEELPRTLAAERVLRELETSSDESAVETSVHAILSVAQTTSDMSVWGAAERVAGKLVDGTLEPSDHEALRDALVDGESIDQAVQIAQTMLTHQEFHHAIRTLQGVVSPLEKRGSYTDTPAVAYRCFGSFSERVLYNRLNSKDQRSVVLVPDAFLSAHLMLSALYLSLPPEEGGSEELAKFHAQRALTIAPLNVSANLAMVACLEHELDLDGANELLSEFLRLAYHPQGIGLSYYRMAALQWKLGHSRACQACYQRSVQLVPQLLPIVMMECQMLAEQGVTFEDSMDEQDVLQSLEEQHIPTAPSAKTSFILFEGAAASIDAEVFPVARDLMHVIESLTGDDVMRGITASLELEPDE